MNDHADYVVANYPEVLTGSEARAVRTLRGLAKTADAHALREALRRRRVIADTDPEVAALLADGVEAFHAALVDRVRAECPQVVWTMCPRCGGLAKTPAARQCLRCGHAWRVGGA